MSVVEEIIALMRMAESEDEQMATLAKMVLGLVEHARECEARIAVAEAALDTERAKVSELSTALREQPNAGRDIRARVQARRNLATTYQPTL